MGISHGPKTLPTRHFPLQLPVAVLGESLADRTETRDISAVGARFCINEGIKVGSNLVFSIRMPGKALGAPRDVLVNCAGRVVRCSKVKQRHAIDVVIDEYNFQRC